MMKEYHYVKFRFEAENARGLHRKSYKSSRMIASSRDTKRLAAHQEYKGRAAVYKLCIDEQFNAQNKENYELPIVLCVYGLYMRAPMVQMCKHIMVDRAV